MIPGRLVLLPLALLLGCPSNNGNLGDDDSAADDDTVTGDDDSVSGDDDSMSDDDDSTPGDDDDTTPQPQDADLVGTIPEDGDNDVYVGSAVWAEFDDVPANPVIALWVTDTGAPVAGELQWAQGTLIYFQPDAPLAGSTSYGASISWDVGHSESIEFETGTDGTIPVNLNPSGLVFEWDLAAGTVVTPPGGDTVIGNIPASLLMEVESATETTLDMLAGLAEADSDPAVQDLCFPTFSMTDGGVVWNDPVFTAGPVDFSQTFDIPQIGPVPVTFHDATFGGYFAANTAGDAIETIEEGTFSAWVDTAEMGLQCSWLSFLGVTCGACPDEPSREECLVMWVEDLQAVVVPGLDLLARSQADVDNDSACQ